MHRRMKSVYSVWLFAILAIALSNFGADASFTQRQNETAQIPKAIVPGHILVQFRPGVSARRVRNLIAAAGALDTGQIPNIGVHIVKVPPATDAEAFARAFRSVPDVQFAEPDYFVHVDDVIPNDPLFVQQYHLPLISCPTAWSTTTGSSDVIIAVVDTGTNPVPDLAGKLVPGWNFDGNNSDTSDVHGHGTWVAGTAAAIGNNQTGVASPAWQCRIMPIRVANEFGWAQVSNIARAIVWAADHGARVANASFSATSYSVVGDAARYMSDRGGVVTISAGNDGIQLGDPDDPYILTVSATNQTDGLATFTTTGNYVDLAAPGVSILTTDRDGSYKSVSGTSFSAPMTAGVAAMVLSVNPGLSGMQVQSIIKQAADDLGPAGWDPGYGCGRLNAARAVALAVNPGNLDLTPPSVSITAPASGASLTGQVTVEAQAIDNVGVGSVSFSVDGLPIGVITIAPYQATWNTANITNGTHILVARAVDGVGNATQAAITVSTSNGSGDTTPPVPVFVSPVATETLSGSFTVELTATDNLGVVSVQIQVDNDSPIAPDLAPPYTFSLNTLCMTNAQHTITAMATDAAGNVGTAQITINVYNTDDVCPPRLTVNYPTSGATLTGSILIQATATDNVGVSEVYARLDTDYNNKISSDTSAPYNLPWNTATAANGSHWLYVFARDAHGNSASVSVSVNLQNTGPTPDTTPPQISITSPADGDRVPKSTKQVGVLVNALDNVAVLRVELYADGALAATSTSAPFTTTWSLRNVSRGQHTLQCKAYDAAGNMGVSASIGVSK